MAEPTNDNKPKAAGKKKGKVVKVSLNEFLKSDDSSSTNTPWGDVENDQEFDHHHREEPRQSNSDRPYGNRGEQRDRSRYPDRTDRERDYEPRHERKPQNEVPDHPPFVAYVGNLNYSVTERSLSEFFGEECEVVDCRIQYDLQTGEKRSKGFGYVTFKSREDLIHALEANNVDFQGRALRVDVSTPKSNTPTRDSSSNYQRHNRDDREPKPSRFEPSRADATDKWERGNVVTPKAQTPPRSEAPRREYRKDNRDRSEHGDREDRRDNRDRGDREDRRDNRDRGDRGDRGERGDRNRNRDEEPRERVPLKLQPKSETPSTPPIEAEEKKSNKPNPFGNAKPRDEKAYEERRKELEALKQKEEAEKKSSEPEAAEPSSDVQPANNNAESKPAADNKPIGGSKYNPPRGGGGNKNYNNNNRNYNNNRNNNYNNNNNNKGQKKPQEKDSDGFVVVTQSAKAASSAAAPTPASGPTIKNKYSALSNDA